MNISSSPPGVKFYAPWGRGVNLTTGDPILPQETSLKLPSDLTLIGPFVWDTGCGKIVEHVDVFLFKKIKFSDLIWLTHNIQTRSYIGWAKDSFNAVIRLTGAHFEIEVSVIVLILSWLYVHLTNTLFWERTGCLRLQQKWQAAGWNKTLIILSIPNKMQIKWYK
jgi:hypothetical protein